MPLGVDLHERDIRNLKRVEFLDAHPDRPMGLGFRKIS